jgi:hypothetical protein
MPCAFSNRRFRSINLMIDWNNALFTTAFAPIKATRADRWLRRATQRLWCHPDSIALGPGTNGALFRNRFLEVTPDFLNRVITLLYQEGFDLIALDEVPARLERNRTRRPFAVVTSRQPRVRLANLDASKNLANSPPF